MNYLFHIIVMIGIYLILTQSLNLVMGYTGLLSVCQAAFYGIGAYTSTLLMTRWGVHFLPALLAGIVVAVALSFVVSVPTLRLRGDYFVLATLGFQAIVFGILYNWVSLTRGPYGIPGIPSPNLFGLTFQSPPSYMLLTTALALVTVVFVYLVTSCQFGRVLKTIREDEVVSQALGRNPVRFKITAFALGAGVAAIAGSLFAGYMRYIDPTSFTVAESLFLVTILAIGGSGNIKGPVVGTVILVMLPEALRFLQIPDSVAANVRMMLYALALVLVVIYRPRGLAGEFGFE
ncbi:MAG: branched-chain amino acid ABC transporter permease [candidate division KSB1 bacterium]|nr:branched-chain amino acid ABC transporter permease [candidate division KSB1 bacterium]